MEIKNISTTVVLKDDKTFFFSADNLETLVNQVQGLIDQLWNYQPPGKTIKEER